MGQRVTTDTSNSDRFPCTKQNSRKKSKDIWLGKCEQNKLNPLQLKWPRTPVRILGIFVSYDVEGNDDRDFNLKLRKLQTNLDMWRARDLTLFGRVLIIKSLGLSQIIFSSSILNIPEGLNKIE